MTNNDLTLNELPARQISPALSPGLRQLLDSDLSYEGHPTREIANTPSLRAEAEAVLPVLRAAAFQECGDEGVRQVIGRRFALYPQPDRSDEEWAAWWADYLDVLGQVSWAALEAAMMSWVSNPASEFMPKPGKLLELSRTTPNKAAKRYERCRKAVDWVGNRPLPPIAYHGDHLEDYAPAPAADKEAVAKMLAEFKASVAKDRPVRGEDKLPSIAGKTDETGITPEMRDILARREDGGL